MSRKKIPTVYVHKQGYTDLIRDGRAKITYTPTSQDNEAVTKCFGITIGNLVYVRNAGGCNEVPLAKIEDVQQYKTVKGDVVHFFIASIREEVEDVVQDNLPCRDESSREDKKDDPEFASLVKLLSQLSTLPEIAAQLKNISEGLSRLVNAWQK